MEKCKAAIKLVITGCPLYYLFPTPHKPAVGRYHFTQLLTTAAANITTAAKLVVAGGGEKAGKVEGDAGNENTKLDKCDKHKYQLTSILSQELAQ